MVFLYELLMSFLIETSTYLRDLLGPLDETLTPTLADFICLLTVDFTLFWGLCIDKPFIPFLLPEKVIGRKHIVTSFQSIDGFHCDVIKL